MKEQTENKDVSLEDKRSFSGRKKEIEPELYRELFDKTNIFMDGENITPPLSMSELKSYSDRFLEKNEHLVPWRDWVMVMMNNTAWKDIVAGVPYERRILLLPQCLRDAERCQADIDEYGLLCKDCASCAITELQNEADSLGMMCMVAEGAAVVPELLESRSVDAVIGISCIEALERSFPHLIKNAVAGLAFPLYGDGCKDTSTDIDIVRDALRKYQGRSPGWVNLNELMTEVKNWFVPESVEELLGKSVTATDSLAREWLLRGGRRFRPFLAAVTVRGLGVKDTASDIALRKIALAIECFHKASLLHDDIEDLEISRYGLPTLHEERGVPVSLNVGDLLLGEGYRLLTEKEIPRDVRDQLFRIASRGHVTLCRGQGEDLIFRKERKSIPVSGVLNVLKNKTSPAFEVAVLSGLAYAGGTKSLYDILSRFAGTLGTAYQIRDDIEDVLSGKDDLDGRLSIVKALGEENGSDQRLAEEKAKELYEHYRTQTLDTLRPLKDSVLKKVFYEITMRILRDV